MVDKLLEVLSAGKFAPLVHHTVRASDIFLVVRYECVGSKHVTRCLHTWTWTCSALLLQLALV